MNWSASVLSTVSSDTEPTILLTFDSAKYIFNAGENTNRAFLQSRDSWKRTRGMFFTDIGTQRTGGIAGLLMSFADATISKLDLVGPPGLVHLLASMRLYTYRDTMPIQPTEASWTPSASPPDPIYKDENITVYGVPVLPTLTEESRFSASTPDLAYASITEASLKRKRDPSPDHPVKRSSATSGSFGGPSLQDLMRHSDFSPEVLVGESGQDWRRLLISTMFPGSKGHKNGKAEAKKGKEGKGKGKGRKEEFVSSNPDHGGQNLEPINETSSVVVDESCLANVDPYKRSRLPPGYHQQLPHFISPFTADNVTRVRPTLAYVVVGPRVRGKFDIKKATALGVPFGPMRGRLTKGETITFTVKVGDETIERVVRPEECVGESESPGVVLVLDIPAPSHIDSLASSFVDSSFYAQFRSRRPEDIKEYAVRSIFHICGDGVLEDPRYTTFMNGFAPDVHHVVASREHGADPVTFTSAAFNQLRLNQLDSEIFPVLKFSLTPKKDLAAISGLPSTTCTMSSHLLIKMRPPAPPMKQIFMEEYDRFHPAVTSPAPMPLPPSTLERFSEAKANIETFRRSGRLPTPKGADVKILPLGTGSAIPSKYRNVSSTLIQIPNWGNILLDAGEGTWGQLARQFGTDESSSPNVWQVLRDMKCIFISHLHADHHMGLANILAKRRLLDPPPEEPIYLVTIRSVHLYLRELSDLQDLGLDDVSGNGVQTIMSEALHWKQTGAYQTAGMWQVGGTDSWTDIDRSITAADSMCRALGLESFLTVDVFHRTRCYGAVIKHTDGWSIVFSGDTQPTNTLVWAGQGATLLIHEATMADDQAEMAKRKAHSTFGQAIDIGRRMNAENILLTHFSARYPKMPPSGVAKLSEIEESHRKEPVIALAFDHANLTIGKMWMLNYYLPAAEQSFKDTAEEGDEEEANSAATMEIDVM